MSLDPLIDLRPFSDPNNELEDGFHNEEVISNESHNLEVKINPNYPSINMGFSSREALYDFAKMLMWHAVYGETGEVSFFPLSAVGSDKNELVNGVRMIGESPRIFVEFGGTNSTNNK